MRMNEIEYEGNYVDNYDNEISQQQQEEEPCQAADLSRWDKLFIALEDSHMRQNMLLESLEKCCGGMVHLRNQVETLSRATCQQCVPSTESACKAQVEQASRMWQKGLSELRDEEAEREARLNATLKMLVRSEHEGNARLPVPSGAEDSGTGHHDIYFGDEAILHDLQGQEVTSPVAMATVERAMVAIATELERVQQHLSSVIKQAGMLRKDRGDT
ncbi:hypothetical protein Q5P01_020709 [Channa striata]|uniref:Uncharacterized protein n=1 Tax=Channa striata TaxID=64152 RepID=A0AA88S9B0_CHASR|nr:hypothetical protein Q5P01_020709 [Channa striata]